MCASRDGPSADSQAVHDPVALDSSLTARSTRVVGFLAAMGLALLALSLRHGNLAPSTLTHDDAWVAYIYRAEYRDVVTVGLTSPGFVFLMKVWLSGVGFSEFRAQIPALLGGIISPALAFIVLRRRVRVPFAVLAGLLIVFSPIEIAYSDAVKQYTTEVVVGLLLIGCGFRLIEQPGDRKRWLQFTGLAFLASLISFMLSLVAVGAAVAGLVAAARMGGRTFLRRSLLMLPLGLSVGVWYLLVVGPRVPDGLRDLWGIYGGDGRYITTDAGLWGWIGSLWDRSLEVAEWVTRFDPRAVALVVLLAFTFLLVKRPLVFVMTVVPLVGIVVAASLKLAPLGGNRTDIWLHAPLIVGVISGLDAMVDVVGAWISRIVNHRSFDPESRTAMASAALLTALIGGTALLLHQPATPYALQDVRPLIEELDAERTPDDVVIVDYEAMYHLGLYGRSESHPFSVTDVGFRHYWVEFDDPTIMRIQDRSQATGYADEAAERGNRIWFLVSINPFTKSTRDAWDPLTDRLRQIGWSPTKVEERTSAVLELWGPTRAALK